MEIRKLKYNNKYSYIILGAGAPHAGKAPAALHETSFDQSVLEWVSEAYATNVSNILFVAGYRAHEIRQQYPNLELVENVKWKNTGSFYSLLLAKPETKRPLFVNYGDVLFRKDLIVEMQQSTAPITIAYDSQKKIQPSALEKREKVIVNDGQTLRLGYDVPDKWSDGEFIGVVKFSVEAVNHLLKIETVLGKSVQTMHLSDAIEFLRGCGLYVQAIDVAGEWAEVREPRDIAHFVLGTKAETLARLSKVLKTATIEDQVSFSVADWEKNHQKLVNEINEKLVLSSKTNLIVRSSSKAEDSFTSSNAGGFDSVLNVDPSTKLETAVEQVIRSYKTTAPDNQVLVQRMLDDVVMSGVIFTRTLEELAPWYVINFETSGSTDGITSGSANQHQTLYVKRGVEPTNIDNTDLAAVLITIIEIEELLCYDSLDIEFAVNSFGEVFIFQVRPIACSAEVTKGQDEAFNQLIEKAKLTWNNRELTRPTLPGSHAPLYGIMPDWNPAEIIGTAPADLALSLYRFLITDETWAIQRSEYGYRDVRPSPLLVSFAGRPYVDVRASFASFIPKSIDEDLASRLLSFYLDWLHANPTLHDKVEFEVVPTCLSPDFSFWENRLTKEGGFIEEELAQIRAGLYGITANAFARIDEDYALIKVLSDRHTKTITTIKDPLERAFTLLDDCRRFGTLPFAHLARSAFVAVALLRGAERISAISSNAVDSFLSTIRTVSHSFTEDAKNVFDDKLDWETFVARYGHLRPGTYDINSPRYDSDPDTFLKPVLSLQELSSSEVDTSADWMSERAAFFETVAELNLPSGGENVEKFLKKAIEGREYAKFIFSRSLSDAIEALAEFGESVGLTRKTLADIPVTDLLAMRDTANALDISVKKLQLISAENLKTRALSSSIKLPSLLREKSDFQFFTIGADLPNFIGQEAIISDLVNLEHMVKNVMPNIKNYIVLIPQADPGYDWLFSQGISGLVTMYGGANSHMAIRAAEFGLPAAIGIGEQQYRKICSGRVLELDPRNQTLRLVQ